MIFDIRNFPGILQTRRAKLFFMKFELLVVDDEKAILRSLKRGLEQHGYGVSTASTVADAIKILVSQRIDACVTDFGLSDKSGLDLLKWVRATPKISKLPVIIHSGSLAGQNHSELQAFSPTKILLKPVAIEEIANVLNDVLEKVPIK
jgi:DNA-binding response OmpR family regulator